MNLNTSMHRINLNDNETTSDEREHLLNDLHNVLEKLLRLTHQGDSTNEQFSALTAKAGTLVGTIAHLGFVDSEVYKHKIDKVRELYKTLFLVLAAEKADISEKLSQIRKGRKIISVYRTNR